MGVASSGRRSISRVVVGPTITDIIFLANLRYIKLWLRLEYRTINLVILTPLQYGEIRAFSSRCASVSRLQPFKSEQGPQPTNPSILGLLASFWALVSLGIGSKHGQPRPRLEPATTRSSIVAFPASAVVSDCRRTDSPMR